MAEVLAGKEMFAELLSRGLTPVQIRERMGVSKSAAYGYLHRIRTDLGIPARD